MCSEIKTKTSDSIKSGVARDIYGEGLRTYVCLERRTRLQMIGETVRELQGCGSGDHTHIARPLARVHTINRQAGPTCMKTTRDQRWLRVSAELPNGGLNNTDQMISITPQQSVQPATYQLTTPWGRGELQYACRHCLVWDRACSRNKHKRKKVRDFDL